MRHVDPEIPLTPEQEAEAALIEDLLLGKAKLQTRRIARLLASKENRQLFGETEFQLRDMVHELAADGMDAALVVRKKRGTRDQAWSAPAATGTPGSSATPRSS